METSKRKESAIVPVGENSNNHGWKAEVITAGIRQGPAFVVLLLILFGLWGLGNYLITDGIPTHFQQIRDVYREIQEAHDHNLQRLIQSFEAEQLRYKTIIDFLERVADHSTILKQNHELLLEAVRHLRALDKQAEKGPKP